MQTRVLNVGDRIRCDVRGQKFTATFRGESYASPGIFLVDGPNPSSVTYRHVTARQILGKVEGQDRLEVGA